MPRGARYREQGAAATLARRAPRGSISVAPLLLNHVPQRHPDDGWQLADPFPMDGASRRALRGILRALCPPPPAPSPPDLEDRLELHVRRLLRYMPLPIALGFFLAIHLLDWSPVWRGVALRRVQHLDKARAERLLTDIGMSPSPLVRVLILAARGVALSVYFDQDEVHEAIGYRPVPFLVERIAVRRRLLAGEAPRPEDAVFRSTP